MDEKEQYNAEDGLSVLKYLGITNLTKEETQKFRENWPNFYPAQGLVSATWKLYAEALPFMCGDGDNGSFMAAQLRDRDFGERLEQTELDKELKKGKSLCDILSKGNHIFINVMKLP
jgi:hypothetical protein